MSDTPRNPFCRTAFSLPDLLATMAGLLLLAAVMAPTAGRLTGYQRTSLCISRTGEIAKAFLLYSHDYDEFFPFVSTMHYYPSLPDNSVPDPNETWLVNCQTGAGADPAIARSRMRTIAYNPQSEWTDEANVPAGGTLFPYTRSADLYRCPEFEQVSDSGKVQNVFNYSRPMWARRWRMAFEYGGTSEPWGNTEGPILRVADIHRPDELPMILDEQWDRHVGTAGTYPGGINYQTNPCHSPYVAGDYGFFPDNIIAASHGAPVASELHFRDYRTATPIKPFLWKKGGVGFYDGHAALMRDPWPTFELDGNKRSPSRYPWRLGGAGIRYYDELMAVEAFMQRLLFWQRGFDPASLWQGIVIPPF